MRLRFTEALGAVIALAVTIAACAIAIVSLCGCAAGDSSSTWPESTEFSTLESGQGRFGMSETNLDSCFVIVDHRTGVQYLLYGEAQGYGNTSWAYTGLCPLLDVDGTPLLVAEAGGESR